MEDGVDGIVAGDVLYLATAEIIFFSQQADILIRQIRQHGVPNASTDLKRRLVELDFVEEPSFKSLIHILGKIRRGDKDTVEGLHLL